MSARDDLGERGKSIWDAYGAAALAAGNRALVLEIARTADTLDRLDKVLLGDQTTWIELIPTEMGDISLTINGVLAERRQQQLALKQLLMEARNAGLKQDGTAQTGEDEKENRGATILRLRDRMG